MTEYNNVQATLREKILAVFGIACILVATVFVIWLIKIAVPYSLIPLGAVIWYVYYVIEVMINGGSTAGFTIFEHVGNDFKNNFGRNSKQHRLDLARGDEWWASEFPGKIHCIVTHVIIPLTPLLIWIAL